MDGETETNAQRPRLWLAKALVVGCLVLIALLTLAGVFGPDPRYLLLRRGMTQSEVAMLMGKPDIYDFYDDPGDGRERPGWFYTYMRSEIILLWNPDGTLHSKLFLHSYWPVQPAE